MLDSHSFSIWCIDNLHSTKVHSQQSMHHAQFFPSSELSWPLLYTFPCSRLTCEQLQIWCSEHAVNLQSIRDFWNWVLMFSIQHPLSVACIHIIHKQKTNSKQCLPCCIVSLAVVWRRFKAINSVVQKHRYLVWNYI